MQGAPVWKPPHDLVAFGHDGSFGHDGPVIKRAPSSAARYSNVSIAVPEPPVLGRDGSAAATPKLFSHREMLPTSLRGDTPNPLVWPDGCKRMAASDIMFNTAPSTFKPTCANGSQHIGSPPASVHSGYVAVSEDGNNTADRHSDQASDIPSDTSKLLDGFDGVQLSIWVQYAILY